MRKFLNHFASVLALALFAVAAQAAMPEVKVLLAEGEIISGAIEAIEPQGLKVAGRTIALKDIAQLKFPTARVIPPHAAPAIFLRNTDALYESSILSGTDSKLKLRSASFGDVELDYKLLDRIVFYGGANKKLPDGLDAFFKLPAPKEDLLLTLKGETVSGFFEKFSDKDIAFNSNGQSRAYTFEQLAAVRLAALEKMEATPTLNAHISAANGSHATGRLKALEANVIVFEAAGGQDWKCGGYEIASIEFKGGRMVYLSALDPLEAEQKPLIGGTPLIFSWRKDRSSAGTALKIGAQEYENGIGVHSYCRLAYDLDAKFAMFLSDVGLDASAADGASCIWKVLLDGVEAAHGTAASSAEKIALKLDVSKTKRLELICDFGPGHDDAGGRLDFGAARLIKP